MGDDKGGGRNNSRREATAAGPGLPGRGETPYERAVMTPHAARAFFCPNDAGTENVSPRAVVTVKDFTEFKEESIFTSGDFRFQELNTYLASIFKQMHITYEG